jgi:GNAT superfamily N-acetyltransferase
MSEPWAEVRPLRPDELARVGEIDRSERIDAVYLQRGARLERLDEDRSASSWLPDGDGEHSVAAQQSVLEHELASGATVLGAFEGDRLIGIGAVLPHVRPQIAQLTFLYVSDGRRGTGIGGRLCAELERVALAAGDVEMVVSATPSVNTVDFYLRRGFEPMAEPLSELLEREPEDVHLWKRIVRA